MAKKMKLKEKEDKTKIKNINPLCIKCPYECWQYNIGTIQYCKWTKEINNKSKRR